MSNQKHTVSTDALDTLGTIIDETAGRDAIHLAVEPVIAGENLDPGTHVSLKDGIARASGRTVGIVDPFLETMVSKGDRFWLVVYPRQITSLRHVWEHPAFPQTAPTLATMVTVPEPTPKELAESWLRDYAVTTPISFERIMSAAEDHIKSGEYLSMGGLLEGYYVPTEFWEHFQVYTGHVVPSEDRGSFFSCSC